MSVYPQARFLLSVNDLQQLPADSGAEVAFVGRSNAGKSSTINVITQRNALARKSKTPGQTQLINLFELEPQRRLVDLPGYGYAKVPPAMQAHWQELVGGYLHTRESLSGLFLIVDARRGLKDDDVGLLNWAHARVLRTHVLLNKSDKLTRNETREVLKQTESQLNGQASVQLFSALNKDGADAARKILKEMLEKNTPMVRGSRATGAD